MRLTAILLAGLLLSACQSQRHYPADSPYSRIPVGSVFTLHQPLTIPIEDVAIKIQDGEAKVYKPIYFFDVWCEIELKSRNPEAILPSPGLGKIPASSLRSSNPCAWRALGQPRG
jgi:hypothetical protein